MKQTWIVIFLLLVSFSALAQEDSDVSGIDPINFFIRHNFYVDAYAYSGFSQLNHSDLSNKSYGYRYGFGGSYGPKIGEFFFYGMSLDLDFYSQSSTVDSEHLNFSGRRFIPFSPTIGFLSKVLTLKIAYQFLGNLEMNERIADGSEVMLQRVNGLRVSLYLHKFSPHMPIGIYYEQTRYKQKDLSNQGVQDLSDPVITWQAGIIIGFTR